MQYQSGDDYAPSVPADLAAGPYPAQHRGAEGGNGVVSCPPRIRRYIPLLASPQGGVAASSKKISRSHRSRRSRGGFPSVSIGKPPRPRDQRMLRDILLIARPPLLAVKQGGEWPLPNIRIQTRPLPIFGSQHYCLARMDRARNSIF